MKARYLFLLASVKLRPRHRAAVRRLRQILTISAILLLPGCRGCMPPLLPGDGPCTNAGKVLSYYSCPEAKDARCASFDSGCVVAHSESLREIRWLCRVDCAGGSP